MSAVRVWFGLLVCARSCLRGGVWLRSRFGGVVCVGSRSICGEMSHAVALVQSSEAVKGRQALNRVKLLQAVKPIKCRYKADKGKQAPRNTAERVKPYNII